MKKSNGFRPPARMSGEAVWAKTGKTWSEWLKVLDGEDARKMDHKGIVTLLRERHGLDPWWQQMVTVSYEQATGKRNVHERPSGFEISRSKTVNVPVAKLCAAWETARARARWLRAPNLVARRVTPRKFIRMIWVDGGTYTETSFSREGWGKNQVTVQHRMLTDVEAAERMKAYWGKQLDYLKKTVES